MTGARACATMSLSTSPILAAAASNDLHTVRWLVERESVPVDCSAGLARARLERREQVR